MWHQSVKKTGFPQKNLKLLVSLDKLKKPMFSKLGVDELVTVYTIWYPNLSLAFDPPDIPLLSQRYSLWAKTSKAKGAKISANFSDKRGFTQHNTILRLPYLQSNKSNMLCWFILVFKILHVNHVTCIQSTISDVRKKTQDHAWNWGSPNLSCY